MIDFHSHVLHDIDDGAPDIETSVLMLEDAFKKGTDTVVLTSHYYAHTEKSLAEFLEKRQERYCRLKEACNGKEIPRLLLGAEVNISEDFFKFERIHELCIEGTDYMLIEMPPSKAWDESIIESVHNLKTKGVKPIVAHIDRYLHHSRGAIHALAELNPVFQVNSDMLMTKQGRKILIDLFNRGLVHVLGSDMHDMVKRSNKLDKAFAKLRMNFGDTYADFVEKNGRNILENKEVLRNRRFPKTRRLKWFI